MALPVFAQNQQTGEGSLISKPRRQITTIIFSGLAGAVLGLSTLSFYGRPQEKLSNIAMGFAVGVITGTVITTYQTATRPYDYIDVFYQEKKDRKLNYLAQGGFVPKFTYSWEF